MENLEMDNTSSRLLPYILQTLSRKPELCETHEKLREEIEYMLSTENRIGDYQNIEKNISDALYLGKNLGVLAIRNDLIRMPFQYNKDSATSGRSSSLKKKLTKGPSSLKKGAQRMDLSSQRNLLIIQPQRTHTSSVRPTLIAEFRRRRSFGVRRSGRTRSRTSSRQQWRSRR